MTRNEQIYGDSNLWGLMFNYKHVKIIYDLDLKSFDIVPLPLEFKKICKILVDTPIGFF